jgi:hypothetical protein
LAQLSKFLPEDGKRIYSRPNTEIIEQARLIGLSSALIALSWYGIGVVTGVEENLLMVQET